MVVVMKERASDAQIEKVIAHLVELGMDVHRSSGASRTVLGVVGTGKVDPRLIEMLEGVHEVLRISEPYKLASRTMRPENTVIEVPTATGNPVRIGGSEIVVMAGPCSVESRSQLIEIIGLFGAKAVDLTSEIITVEATGSPAKLQALLDLLEPYGIRELVQSGLVALGRGNRSLTDRNQRSERLKAVRTG